VQGERPTIVDIGQSCSYVAEDAARLFAALVQGFRDATPATPPAAAAAPSQRTLGKLIVLDDAHHCVGSARDCLLTRELVETGRSAASAAAGSGVTGLVVATASPVALPLQLQQCANAVVVHSSRADPEWVGALQRELGLRSARDNYSDYISGGGSGAFSSCGRDARCSSCRDASGGGGT
jgi:hypothetical protein